MESDELNPTEINGYPIEKRIFRGPKTPDRGFELEAFYLKEPFSGDALCQLYKDGKVIRKFIWPAYKVYNLTAHFSDIVDGELQNSSSGYELAGWTGFN